MSSSPRPARKRLPVNPSLEHLKKQAKRKMKDAPGLSLQQAQHQLAIDYGCANWTELSHVVETMTRGATQTSNVKSKMEPLPAAANASNLQEVRRVLQSEPFTQHDLDLALARAVLRFGERKAIAELLIDAGADPDGQYGGNYGPIVFVTGECLDPDGLQFLIDHGADVSMPPVATKYGNATIMSHTLGTYARGHNDRKHRCIKILLQHGAPVPPTVEPAMFAIHRGDVAAHADLLDRDPSLLSKTYPSMPYGNIDLRGAGLLHLAVEFGEIECVDALLDRNADINLRSEVIEGIGGQTPVFHAIGSNLGANLSTLEHLVRRLGKRIDLTVSATFRLYGETQSTPRTPVEYSERASSAETPDWQRANPRELELLRSIAR